MGVTKLPGVCDACVVDAVYVVICGLGLPTRNRRALRQQTLVGLLKSATRSPRRTFVPVLALPTPRVLGAAYSTTHVDEPRSGLLAATRRMTVLVMAVLPIFVLTLTAVWSFRSADCHLADRRHGCNGLVVRSFCRTLASTGSTF